MQLILMVVEAIGLVVGSLAAAVLLCWFLWYAFRLVLHPEWAVSVVLMLLLLAFAGELPKSQFLDMTLTFAVVAAVPLWFAGRAWRKQRSAGFEQPAPATRRATDERGGHTDTICAVAVVLSRDHSLHRPGTLPNARRNPLSSVAALAGRARPTLWIAICARELRRPTRFVARGYDGPER